MIRHDIRKETWISRQVVGTYYGFSPARATLEGYDSYLQKEKEAERIRLIIQDL